MPPDGGASSDLAFAPYEFASPTLLAAQPPSPPDTERRPGEDWNEIFTHLESRLGMLRTWRYSWWTYWSQLAEYILPKRYHWLVTANLMRRGSPINQTIVDSTATLAMNICSAGMVDGLMPTTRKWFKHGVAIPEYPLDNDAKLWLEALDTALETVFSQSNFYSIMAQAFQDLVVFGTAPVIMYEDPEDVLRCYCPCAGEYYLAVGSRLSVDTQYREFTLTVAQIVEMFTLAACPQQVQEQWQTAGASLEVEYVVAHAIEPNFALSSRGRGKSKSKISPVPGKFTYREFYWLKGVKTERELSRRGFHDRPFAAGRWSVVSNDAYGSGPCMDALGDTKQLQLETRRKAEAIEKQVRPPMGADPSMLNQPSSILPGHVTYVSTENGKKGFWPLYEMKFDLSAMIADIKDTQVRIKECLLVDVFNIISQMQGVQPRNELEIAERKGEKLQRLGPVIGLIKTEFAAPLVQRAVGILERKHLVKPRPDSLKNIPLKTEYMDMVTLAQIGAETASMERTFAVGGKLSEAAKAAGLPDPLRVFNLDKSMTVYADKLNFPTECVYTPEEVLSHDKARAQAQQQQQAIPATMAGVTAAKSLSETDVGGGQNALQHLLGTGSGQTGVTGA